MALTDTAIRALQPGDSPYKRADEKGLYVEIFPNGSKLWRLKYRIGGKEKRLALGAYPEISLKGARSGREEARKLIAAGVDPSLEKQRDRRRGREEATNSFEVVAREYFDKRRRDGKNGWSTVTETKATWMLGLLGPTIAKMPITAITPADILAAVRKVERRGRLDTAGRTLQLASRIFRHAVATARLASDPTRDLRGALAAPTVMNRAAILEPVKLGGLLRAIDGYDGSPVTKLALQIAPHVFVRPGELRHADWNEIALDEAIWRIPASRMKMRRPHSVPLSPQVVDLFRFLGEITGPIGYVFPSIRTRLRPMSENTLNAAFRRLGYGTDEVTAHGLRATASTLLNESGKWSSDAIERALAHGDSDAVRGTYARGQFWDERVKMAQWWSDHLDALRRGAEVVPLHKARRDG